MWPACTTILIIRQTYKITKTAQTIMFLLKNYIEYSVGIFCTEQDNTMIMYGDMEKSGKEKVTTVGLFYCWVISIR
jgi:hypothetical protein